MSAKVKACRLCLVFCGTYKRLLLNRTHYCTAPRPLYWKKAFGGVSHCGWKAKQGQAGKLHVPPAQPVPQGTKTLQSQENKNKKKKEGRNTQQEEEAEIVAYLQGLPDEIHVKVVRAPRDCGRFQVTIVGWHVVWQVPSVVVDEYLFTLTHIHTIESVGYMQQCDKSNKKCQGIPVAADITLELQVSSSWQTPSKRG